MSVDLPEPTSPTRKISGFRLGSVDQNSELSKSSYGHLESGRMNCSATQSLFATYSGAWLSEKVPNDGTIGSSKMRSKARRKRLTIPFTAGLRSNELSRGKR